MWSPPLLTLEVLLCHFTFIMRYVICSSFTFRMRYENLTWWRGACWWDFLLGEVTRCTKNFFKQLLPNCWDVNCATLVRASCDIVPYSRWRSMQLWSFECSRHSNYQLSNARPTSSLGLMKWLLTLSGSDINMQILVTDPYIFHMIPLVRKIYLNIKTTYLWCSFLLFSWPFCLILDWYCNEKEGYVTLGV